MAKIALRSRVSLIVALVLFFVGGAVAWIAVDSSQESGPPATRSTISLIELSKRPPIYNLLYVPTDSDKRITVARQQLIGTCMAKHGFHYDSVLPEKEMDSTTMRPNPFGLESLDSLDVARNPIPPRESPKSEEYIHALFGESDKRISAQGKKFKVTRPATGCQAEAETRLLGDGRLRWLQLLLQLGDGAQEARQRLEQDPEFRTANERWRRCMQRAGYDQKDPQQLLEDFPADIDMRTNPATQADVRCKNDIGYLATAYTRLAAAQQKWLDENPGKLAIWKALQLRQDIAAREILQEVQEVPPR